jgi:hypothetical protein
MEASVGYISKSRDILYVPETIVADPKTDPECSPSDLDLDPTIPVVEAILFVHNL